MDVYRLGVAACARAATGAAATAIGWPSLSPEDSVVVQPARDVLVKMVWNRGPIRSEYGASCSIAEWETSLRSIQSTTFISLGSNISGDQYQVYLHFSFTMNRQYLPGFFLLVNVTGWCRIEFFFSTNTLSTAAGHFSTRYVKLPMARTILILTRKLVILFFIA